MNEHEKTEGRLRFGVWAVACVLLVLLTALVNYRTDSVKYKNEDATWHAMLTIRAYQETPASVHKFLPLVSLGGAENKHIPWGATVADKAGNYYYTSFSAAAYAAAHGFITLFHLPVNETSLYIFNTVLMLLSTLLWLGLLYQIFRESRHRNLLLLVGLVSYVMTPEVLQNLGMVYWCHSLMQVTLLLQVTGWYHYRFRGRKWAGVLFYAMALLNPYVEWTGFVANVGFALAEMIFLWKENKCKGFLRACLLGVVTVASGLLFIGHFLLVVELETLFSGLLERFTTRSYTARIPADKIVRAYLTSFLFWWIGLVVLLAVVLLKNRKLRMPHKLVLLVLAFPVLENVLMRQHAIQYTFDRMKLVFPISFLLVLLAQQLLEGDKKRWVAGLLVGVTLACGLGNELAYRMGGEYVRPAPNRPDEAVLADYLEEHYDDSAMGCSGAVRGYLNLLFQRGIYEWSSMEYVSAVAADQGHRYALLVNSYYEPGDPSYIPNVTDVEVYDREAGETVRVSAQAGKILVEPLERN